MMIDLVCYFFPSSLIVIFLKKAIGSNRNYYCI